MRIFRSSAVASVATLLAAVISPASAKTEIQGDVQALTVRLENASIDETLKALEASFELRFRAPGPLAKSISGSYQGSLKEVVKRLLNGYDFVLTTRGTAIEVAVIGKSAAPAITGTPPQNTASVAKPAVMAQQKPPAANMQVAALEADRFSMPGTGKAIDGGVPLVLTQNDASKMPMPTPSKDGGSMPMPTPTASGNGPVPQPPASGSAPMPMPMPDTSGSASMPMPPAPAQSAPEPGQAAQQAPQPATPKPN